MSKTGVWAAILLAAGAARAHDPAASQQQPQQKQQRQKQPAVGPTSDAFNRACIDLLNGRMPEGESAIKALKDACSNLLAGRANERLEAQRKQQAQAAAREQLRLEAQGKVQPGQATAPVDPGTGVLAAFGQAGSELMGSSKTKLPMGMRRSGPVGYTLVTDPVGWFNGLGVNAELYGALRPAPMFSWVGGLRYSSTDATNGTASTYGGMGGIDWFIIGRNNEGLRVGPRLEVAGGREDFGGGNTTFGWLGLGGEVGYNFIASNGITGLLAGGLGGRVAGDEKNEDFKAFVGGTDFGPYIKLGLGLSW